MESSFPIRKRLGLLQPSEFPSDGVPLMDSGISTPSSLDYPYTPSPFSSHSTPSDFLCPNFDTSQASSPVQGSFYEENFSDCPRKARNEYPWTDEGWPLLASDSPLGTSSMLYHPQPHISRQSPFLHQVSHPPTSSFVQTSSQLSDPSLRTPRSLHNKTFDKDAAEVVHSHTNTSYAPDQALNIPASPLAIKREDSASMCNGGEETPGNGRIGPPCHAEMSDDDCETSEPYAKLIWRALLSAPGHGMVLKQIYEWFIKHTDKGNETSKGWQNSIRHNLSMNGAFKKVEQASTADDHKKSGCIWVLQDWAVKEGVKSTTRYRKPPPFRRAHRSGIPAPQRQRSGAKGGRAARKSARQRKYGHVANTNTELAIHHITGTPCINDNDSSDPVDAIPVTPEIDSWPYFFPTGSTECQFPPASSQAFNYLDVIGCTSQNPEDSLYYDVASYQDHFPAVAGDQTYIKDKRILAQ